MLVKQWFSCPQLFFTCFELECIQSSQWLLSNTPEYLECRISWASASSDIHSTFFCLFPMSSHGMQETKKLTFFVALFQSGTDKQNLSFLYVKSLTCFRDPTSFFFYYLLTEQWFGAFKPPFILKISWLVPWTRVLLNYFQTSCLQGVAVSLIPAHYMMKPSIYHTHSAWKNTIK